MVEVPLLPWQGALGENLVPFLGRMTTASFGVATFLRASVFASWWCCWPGGDRSRIATAGSVLGSPLCSVCLRLALGSGRVLWCTSFLDNQLSM
uniref:Uncharacterized protein n=1 Tax=Oryza rufipogon TaxID=4529 RepID=A0A0E0N0J5_ORYRU